MSTTLKVQAAKVKLEAPVWAPSSTFFSKFQNLEYCPSFAKHR